MENAIHLLSLACYFPLIVICNTKHGKRIQISPKPLFKVDGSGAGSVALLPLRLPDRNLLLPVDTALYLFLRRENPS